MNGKQGEIWWISPSPLAIGSEQQGLRPALIIQNDVANTYLRTTIVALISSSGRSELPEMILLDDNEGLSKVSYADFAQLYTIDQSRLETKVGALSAQRWNEVEKALERVFFRTVE